MFNNKEITVLRIKSKLSRLKDNFSRKCRKIIEDNHSNDWAELEEGFQKSVKEHYEFWDATMKRINFCAEEFCFNLKADQDLTKYNFTEFLEDVLMLNPKSTPDMLAQVDYMDKLPNIFRLDDYRSLQDTRNASKNYQTMNDKTLENCLTKRKQKIQKNQILLNKKQKGVMNGVKDSIMKAYHQAAALRKVEFKKIWVKYVKIGREIDTLHHKENLKVRDLEFKKLHKEKYGQFVEKNKPNPTPRLTKIQMDFQRRLYENGKL